MSERKSFSKSVRCRVNERTCSRALQTLNPAPDSSQGVYGDPQCARGLIDHSVTVLGYDLRGSKPHWLLVNSWGTEWGEQVRCHFHMPALTMTEGGRNPPDLT